MIVNDFIKLKQIKSFETGRSMVEMLAVIVIIGILTIGGINGFRYVLDSHHAKTIVEGAYARMVSLSRPEASYDYAASQKTLRGFRTTSAGDFIMAYPVTLEQPEGEGPTLVVSEISKGVCDRLRSYKAVASINKQELSKAVCNKANNNVARFTLLMVDLKRD